MDMSTSLAESDYEAEILTFCSVILAQILLNRPQPLYNTIVGIQTNFRVSYPIPVSYPIRVIMRVKCIVI